MAKRKMPEVPDSTIKDPVERANDGSNEASSCKPLDGERTIVHRVYSKHGNRVDITFAGNSPNTPSDDLVMYAINVGYKARIAKEKRNARMLSAFRTCAWLLCSVGCAVSAVLCIRSGIWYAALAPVALIVSSAHCLKR